MSMSVGKLAPCGSAQCGPGQPNIVTVDGDISGTLVVTFAGGEVRLRNNPGKVPDVFSLTCPIHEDDDITMVLTAVES